MFRYFVIFTFLFVLSAVGYIFLSAKTEVVDTVLYDLSSFEKGQYYFNHGEFADGTYNLDLAKQYFTEAVQTDPQDNILTWHQLGRIHFLDGNFDAAIYAFKKQIAFFDDQLPSVYYMLGLTYGFRARDRGDDSDWLLAEEAFLQYIDLDEISPWARVDLAWVYFKQGKYQAMIAPIEAGLEYSPNNPWLLNMYGLALMNTNQKDAALASFVNARIAASTLTPTDWGIAYPGNDPEYWEQGLQEFRSAIEKNIALIEGDMGSPE